MERIAILDKKFSLGIPSGTIREKVDQLSARLNKDLSGKEIFFIAVLNGSFIFAADLLRKITLPCRISFVKLASYEGMDNSGGIRELIGINEDLKDKTVVFIEDIVDSGNTLNALITEIGTMRPADMKVVALLIKTEAYSYKHKIEYTGFRIPNRFVVGYGLDYNGYGRNLDAIYIENPGSA